MCVNTYIVGVLSSSIQIRPKSTINILKMIADWIKMHILRSGCLWFFRDFLYFIYSLSDSRFRVTIFCDPHSSVHKPTTKQSFTFTLVRYRHEYIIIYHTVLARDYCKLLQIEILVQYIVQSMIFIKFNVLICFFFRECTFI